MGEPVTAGKESRVSYNRLLSTAGGETFKRETVQEEGALRSYSMLWAKEKYRIYMWKFCPVHLV